MPDDLNERRIQHAAHERRVLLRARFVFALTGLVFLIGAAQAMQVFVNAVRTHQVWYYPAGDLAAGLVFLIAGLVLARQSRQVHRLLQKSRQSQTTNPPDFTPLSDGKQQSKNLDKLK